MGIFAVSFLLLFGICLVGGTFIPTNNTNSGWFGVLSQLSTRNQRLENENSNVIAENRRLISELASAQSSYKQCQSMAAKFPTSCAGWKRAGYSGSGSYVIDPDGPGGVGQFTVECIMNVDTNPTGDFGEAITVMHHDSETRINAGKCEEPKSCVRNVTYQASLNQIISLINISRECKQFIKYDCLHSLFHGTGTFDGYVYHAWYSRNGTLMDYWGGATPGSGKCACGMFNSCDRPGLACNCDVNDLVWRSDYGYLTEKDYLPVTKMAFGDLSSPDETGYHRLGALHCFGSK